MDKWTEQTQKDGKATEHSRLEGQHEVLIYSMGGKAVYAPVDLSKPGLQILDSGCDNGRWLLDLRAFSTAKHEYYGTDVNDPYPSSPPENVHFQNQNIREDFPAEWDNKFDLIHQRLVMAGSMPGGLEPVVEKFVRMLKPGGWLQLIEMDTSERHDNSPMMKQFIDMLREMSAAVGLGGNFSATMKGLLEKQGLVDIHEQSFSAQHGVSIKDKSLVQKSIASPVAAVKPVLGVVKSVQTQTSFKDEQLDGFEDRLRKELETKGGNTKFLVVWGRKPS